MDNILKCTCKNEYQDGKYGPNMRVHTVGTKKVTCTVCGANKGGGK